MLLKHNEVTEVTEARWGQETGEDITIIGTAQLNHARPVFLIEDFNGNDFVAWSPDLTKIKWFKEPVDYAKVDTTLVNCYTPPKPDWRQATAVGFEIFSMRYMLTTVDEKNNLCRSGHNWCDTQEVDKYLDGIVKGYHTGKTVLFPTTAKLYQWMADGASK